MEVIIKSAKAKMKAFATSMIAGMAVLMGPQKTANALHLRQSTQENAAMNLLAEKSGNGSANSGVVDLTALAQKGGNGWG